MGSESAPVAESAERFLDRAEERIRVLSIEAQRADWVQSTYLTEDTSALAGRASARLIETTVALVRAGAPLLAGAVAPGLKRRYDLLRLSLPFVAPGSEAEAGELSDLVNSMQARYATHRVELPGRDQPVELEELDRILASGRDPSELRAAWAGWHRAARPLRPLFERYVELANRGAREIGFEDTGAMWRSKYDMAPEEFAREVEGLWEALAPLYRALHAFVRRRLVQTYGPEVVKPDGPIPAHLLGNMWAQSWEHLLPILGVGPPAVGDAIAPALLARGTTPRGLVEYGEGFFVSLGFDRLPESFWNRSMLVRPTEREVVCHASAWDIDFEDDVRLKMCLRLTGEDFRVVHHELGHTYYQRAYAHQPFLYRDGAHDGFHEAIGDTIGLSVTPEYLTRIGLGADSPGPEEELAALLRRAVESIAFLPFAYLVDRWRWQVFDGTITPAHYNASFWAERRRYQGIAPPEPRGEEEFDPGAKYHVAASVPYVRYFLAAVLQFQLHRALARAIGATGPIHRVSIFGRPEAGEKLRAMLEMGASRPWPEALEAISGERRMDPSALLEYFAPLRRFLDSENRGHPVGW
ncbi:MAG: M2 family metallopeptidase [Thermoplasmata archaeon]